MENKSIPILYEGEGNIIQPADFNAFRELNRKKNKKLESKLMTEEEAIERFVKDGDYIGFELYGTVRAPISLTRALIRSGKKDFRLAGQGVHEVDLLLGANLIRETDFTYIGLEVFGVSGNVRRRVESGDISNVVEWSNASLTWRFKAAAMGIPFIATKCMLGSDTLRRSAAKVIECPFSGEKLALLPALILDVGFIHVNRADKYGNCQIDGIGGFAFEMSRASKKLIISAEEIIDTEEIRSAPDRTIIPYYLVDSVVHAPYASWPGEMVSAHEKDVEHYNMYLKKQKTEEGMNEYLKEWVYDIPNHQALLEKIGKEKLDSLKL
ncbi:MAG: CoA transferase subunit A [Candidatus Cloacimonetes bacterium]|nr:CoA transferase subunit A [Candidatus Cloacimonadota bacterium]